MSLYSAACNIDPNNTGLNWWGYASVTSSEEFDTAWKYCADTDKSSISTPEESFMFLLFVALAEGERFNKRPNVSKLVKGQKYLIQINCLTQYAMDICKSARNHQYKDFYPPLGAVKIGIWDGSTMSVWPWWIGPADFSIIKKL